MYGDRGVEFKSAAHEVDATIARAHRGRMAVAMWSGSKRSWSGCIAGHRGRSCARFGSRARSRGRESIRSTMGVRPARCGGIGRMPGLGRRWRG